MNFTQPTAAGGFGQPAAAGGGFGQPSAGGGFGQPQQNAGGFGQPASGGGGFGQPAAGAGFGQPAAGGFGQPASGGGFGQPAAGGGFGQPAAGGGFGQPAAGGFGQPAAGGGFGQPAAGGFGQPQQNTSGFGAGRGAGFGQPAAGGGFGQPQQNASGFGQPGNTSGFGAGRGGGGFGQPAAGGGFGQPAAGGGFGQPAAGGGGFGQPAAGGGFGQPAAGGGFGQPAAGGGGFGQPATGGGFGQPAAGSGFGQPAVGGFGQPATGGGFGQAAAGGFGQPQQNTSGFGAGRGAGFGQPAAAGGFGQPQQNASGFGQPGNTSGFGAGRGGGGFGQPAAGGGFGQPAAGGGFGQPAAGGFGQPQQNASGFGAGRGAGFGQPAAAGGFGQPQQNASGFGQPGNTSGFGAGRGGGGFGQPAAGGGFGQPAAGGGFGQPAAGGFGQPQQNASGFGAGRGAGFGQPAAGGGFGQPQQNAGGFGQPAAGGGFGQPQQNTGGFGQPAAGGGFGQPQQNAGGFGQPQGGGFGQGNTSNYNQNASMMPSPAGGYGPSQGPIRPTDLSFLSLPDFNARPYGSVLLFDRPQVPTPSVALKEVVPPTSAGLPQGSLRAWLRPQPAPDANGASKQQPASLTASAISPAALKDILSPSIQLGAQDKSNDGERQLMFGTADNSGYVALPHEGLSSPVRAPANAMAPTCSNSDYLFSPSLEALSEYRAEELRQVRNFRVWRRDGKCSITFLEPVNLVRVEVTEALHLGADGDVLLYPNGAFPPLHTGVNVKAHVTVQRVPQESAHELEERCRRDGAHVLSFHNGIFEYILNDDAEDDQSPAEKPSIHLDQSVDIPPTQPYNIPDTGALQRVHIGAVQEVDDFELPYKLPDMHRQETLVRGKVTLRNYLMAKERPAYFVRTCDSSIHARYVASPQGGNDSVNLLASLTRSFRSGWNNSGYVITPSFSSLRDGVEMSNEVAETLGARASLLSPFFWQKPASRYMPRCAVAALKTLLAYLSVAPPTPNDELDEKLKHHYPLASFSLHRNEFKTSLSEEKFNAIAKAIKDVSKPQPVSRVEALAVKQCSTIINLLNALYGLPESDRAFDKALEETRFLRQLRHRNLAKWLRDELADFLVLTSGDARLSSAEELVQIMLCHKLRDARAPARELCNDDIARVIRVCGEGNQFGGYVEMAKGGFKDGSQVREKVVSLLSGRVEPFLVQSEYDGIDAKALQDDNTTERIVARPEAATWKQLLGIFTFYGCTPDTPAEDIVRSLLDRLDTPQARSSNPLPPYAERMSSVDTKRAKDMVTRGHVFCDAALLLLEGFADGAAPPASCLHPHASSYCATEFLTPFMIVASIRAIQLPRDDSYKIAETETLLGFAAELECNPETWYWGLVPLHMIESEAERLDAVRYFCRRNAFRASQMPRSSDAFRELEDLVNRLSVDRVELEVVEPPAEPSSNAPLNRPSMDTHISLENALRKLTIS